MAGSCAGSTIVTVETGSSGPGRKEAQCQMLRVIARAVSLGLPWVALMAVSVTLAYGMTMAATSDVRARSRLKVDEGRTAVSRIKREEPQP